MKWLSLLLLLGCETEEVRGWKARRSALERRKAVLSELAPGKKSVDEFREAISIPGLVRASGVGARVFADEGSVRLTVSGTAEQCREALAGIADLRWLTHDWRLRLEKGHCEWEARTGAEYAALEQALTAPPTRWVAPAPQLFSGGLAVLRSQVAALEAELEAREKQLGEPALLQRRLDAVQPLIDTLRARPSPCDLAVLERELALDPPAQGALLEVERARLVHPLEPRSDFRLRGLVEAHGGVLTWQCEPL